MWQKAVGLAKTVYTLTRQLPAAEQFGLTSQMRRAAVSIASNIAEGNARSSRKDYIRMLIVARGSLAELDTQRIISQELGLLRGTEALTKELTEVSRMLQALITSLRRKRESTDQIGKERGRAVLP